MDRVERHGDTVQTLAEANTKAVRDFLGRIGITIKSLGVDEQEFSDVASQASTYTFIPETEIVFADPHAWPGEFKLEMPGMHFEATFRRQDVGAQKVLRGVLYIDDTLRTETLKAISEVQLNKLVQRIRALVALSNHDFTMHQAKFFNHSRTYSIVNEILEYGDVRMNKPGSGKPGFRILQIEQLAAAFHKLLFERAYARSPLLRRFVESCLRGSLDTIVSLPLDVRQRWYSVLKFPFYSLFDPNSKEARAVRSTHPASGKYVGMEPGHWAMSIAERVFPLRKDFFDRMSLDGGRLRRELLHGEPYEPREITIEKLFEILYLRPERTTAERPAEGRREILKEIFLASTPVFTLGNL